MNGTSIMIKIMKYTALGKPTVQFDLDESGFIAMEASLHARDEARAEDSGEKFPSCGNCVARNSMGGFGGEELKKRWVGTIRFDFC